MLSTNFWDSPRIAFYPVISMLLLSDIAIIDYFGKSMFQFCIDLVNFCVKMRLFNEIFSLLCMLSQSC